MDILNSLTFFHVGFFFSSFRCFALLVRYFFFLVLFNNFVIVVLVYSLHCFVRKFISVLSLFFRLPSMFPVIHTYVINYTVKRRAHVMHTKAMRTTCTLANQPTNQRKFRMVFKYLTMDENENIHTIHTETNKIIIKKRNQKTFIKIESNNKSRPSPAYYSETLSSHKTN